MHRPTLRPSAHSIRFALVCLAALLGLWALAFGALRPARAVGISSVRSITRWRSTAACATSLI